MGTFDAVSATAQRGPTSSGSTSTSELPVYNRDQSVIVPDGNGSVSFLGGVRTVARLRLRRVLRPHPALQIARVAVPAAFVAGLRGGAAGALLLGNDGQTAHPAASTPSAESTVSVTPFPSGSLVESGLTTDAIRVHRAVCHRHPQFTAIRCLRASSGDRGEGLALDCVISGATFGWNIAN
jgi:hypothetical protein